MSQRRLASSRVSIVVGLAVASSVVTSCAGVLPGVLPGLGASSRERERVPPPVFSTSDTTAVFAPGVISTGDAFASTFMPDGRTVFFTKVTSDRTRSHIMQSQWNGSSWTTPTRAPFSTGERDMHPHVSPDGKALFFSAPRRRHALVTDSDGDWDIWGLRLDSGATPQRMTSLANSEQDEIYPSVTSDSVTYFAVRARGNPDAPSEIRYTHKKIRTTPALVLTGSEVINPVDPYITWNGRVLIIAAHGKDGRGRTDLYALVRRGDGRWSAPRNLGREVNGTDAEFAPSMSPDGLHLFFSRTRYEENRAVGTDIYVVPVSSVPVLRDALAQQP